MVKEIIGCHKENEPVFNKGIKCKAIKVGDDIKEAKMKFKSLNSE